MNSNWVGQTPAYSVRKRKIKQSDSGLTSSLCYDLERLLSAPSPGNVSIKTGPLGVCVCVYV